MATIDLTHNNGYSENLLRVLCALSLTASFVSICSAVVFYYIWCKVKSKSSSYFNLFRQDIVFYLITFNLIKTVLSVIYPILSLSDDYYLFTYKTSPCSALGYLVQSFSMIADYIYLVLSIHIFLLFLKPSLSREYERKLYRTYLPASLNKVLGLKPIGSIIVYEGGIQKWRAPLGITAIVFSFVQGAFIFINSDGFVSYGAYCYVPTTKVWCRLVVNWVAKYIIMVCIIVLYLSVYVYIGLKYQELNRLLRKKEDSTSTSKVVKSLKTGIDLMCNSLRTKKDDRVGVTLSYIDSTNGRKRLPTHTSRHSEGNTGQFNLNDMEFNNELKQINLQNLETRRSRILSQIRLIFVYPACYFFLQLFGFILEMYRYHNGEQGTPFALICLNLIFSTSDCWVLLMAFLFKERPWKYFNGDTEDKYEDFDVIFANTSKTDESQQGSLHKETKEGTSEGFFYQQSTGGPVEGLNINFNNLSVFGDQLAAGNSGVKVVRKSTISGIVPIDEEELDLIDFLRGPA